LTNSKEAYNSENLSFFSLFQNKLIVEKYWENTAAQMVISSFGLRNDIREKKHVNGNCTSR
jgi:hypothetical protein